MKFILKQKAVNPLQFFRSLGYHPDRKPEAFIRRVGGNDFPRFHIYFKTLIDGLELNIHLDQKNACYAGSTAHSGDYDGEVLEQEIERIKNLLAKNN